MPLSYFHGPYNRHKEHKVALFDTTNSQLQAHHYVRINNHIGIEEGGGGKLVAVVRGMHCFY